MNNFGILQSVRYARSIYDNKYLSNVVSHKFAGLLMLSNRKGALPYIKMITPDNVNTCMRFDLEEMRDNGAYFISSTICRGLTAKHYRTLLEIETWWSAEPSEEGYDLNTFEKNLLRVLKIFAAATPRFYRPKIWNKNYTFDNQFTNIFLHALERLKRNDNMNEFGDIILNFASDYDQDSSKRPKDFKSIVLQIAESALHPKFLRDDYSLDLETFAMNYRTFSTCDKYWEY